jgi:hypothetical protein
MRKFDLDYGIVSAIPRARMLKKKSFIGFGMIRSPGVVLALPSLLAGTVDAFLIFKEAVLLMSGYEA